MMNRVYAKFVELICKPRHIVSVFDCIDVYTDGIAVLAG